MTNSALSEISERYRRFAVEEADGRSPLYKDIALSISGDAELLSCLLRLPDAKRQPNLLLAAVRYLFGVQSSVAAFRQTLLANFTAVQSVIEDRSTQTNEPARCSVLLPILSRLRQPIALIEVGASAGLCLLPDKYGYRYGDVEIHPEGIDVPVPTFCCAVNEIVPVPSKLPQIAWRAGLDLNPLDVSDPSDATWLEALVWPGQTERMLNLRAARRIAIDANLRIVKGDLLGDELESLCDEAPADATLVVFHSAALAYVNDEVARNIFTCRASALSDCWISYEAAGVLPDIAKQVSTTIPVGMFLLSVNGSAVGWADPHGASVCFFAD